MRVVCERAVGAVGGEGPAIAAGEKRIVLEMLVHTGGDVLLRLHDPDSGGAALYDARCFQSYLERPPSTWKASSPTAEWMLFSPRDWGEPGFWEGVRSGDDDALARYVRERDAVVAEDEEALDVWSAGRMANQLAAQLQVGAPGKAYEADTQASAQLGPSDPLPDGVTAASPSGEIENAVRGLDRVAWRSPDAEAGHARRRIGELPAAEQPPPPPRDAPRDPDGALVRAYAASARETLRQGAPVRTKQLPDGRVELVFRRFVGIPPEHAALDATVVVDHLGGIEMTAYGRGQMV